MTPGQSQSQAFTLAVLTVGDELLSGEVEDINFPFIARAVTEMGIQVLRHLTVSDDPEEIGGAVRALCGEASALVVTGGLGPTSDDITTASIASALELELGMREDIVEHIRSLFDRMGRPMHEENLKQAQLPVEATEVPGMGTAPGWMMECRGTLVAVLPGVPREMQLMLNTHVLPELQARMSGAAVKVTRRVMTFGLGESDIASRVADIIDAAEVRYGFLALGGPIVVKLTASGASGEAVAAVLDREEALVRERLGDLVYGTDDVAMEAVVGSLLREAGKTVAVAESITAGLIAARLSNVAGSSDYLLGGVVSYSARSKRIVLGLPPELLEEGAVSREVAEGMASAVRELFGADIGLGITGVAGPGTGGESKPVGTVCLGLADAVGARSWELVLPGDRPMIRSIATMGALNVLRLQLQGRDGSRSH